ncbi:hypothetical protein FACS189429_7890 [Bacteroidia bacterium]|nr:hypothetical protein FACS189429_7890 [Bacteroidia bacterium]
MNEIDSVFDIYQPYKYKILDFRNMQGGVLKNVYKVASYLINDTVFGGSFRTQKCYLNEISINSKANFPTLQNIDFNTFTEILKQEDGVNIELFPNKHTQIPANQKIYMLTNNKTASAGEPLVYGLQKSGNAVLVGERTAGAILSPDVFDVGCGYFLAVPIAEYVTADGQTIEGKGIAPNVKIKSEKALDWVYKELGITELTK